MQRIDTKDTDSININSNLSLFTGPPKYVLQSFGKYGHFLRYYELYLHKICFSCVLRHCKNQKNLLQRKTILGHQGKKMFEKVSSSFSSKKRFSHLSINWITSSPLLKLGFFFFKFIVVPLGYMASGRQGRRAWQKVCLYLTSSMWTYRNPGLDTTEEKEKERC